MNLRALETLVRIQQVASFSRAAELQNLTLSALSMQMKTLEAELGAALFDRDCRPPRLTPLGQTIAEQSKVILKESNALKSLAASEDPLVGTHQIGFIQSASVRILPRFLAIAEHEAPLAKFRVVSGLSELLTNQVETGQIEAAVVTKVQGEFADLHFASIATEPMAVAAPISLRDLDLEAMSQRLPFIHFMPSTGIGRLIAAAKHGLPEPAKRTIILDGIEATVECVKAGLGYTILPVPDIRRYADHRVHITTLDDTFPRRELVLATRKAAHSKQWRNRLFEIVRKASVSLTEPDL
ncbi:MAG: LysR family transcriptional regulator [Rhodobacter sp.]|nr:LysR family transcriptional regulator [Rhodobacter sp.]